MRGPWVLRLPALVLACVAFTTLAVANEPATIVRVIDGDTLQVRLAGAIERVRLIGVDTPESVHPKKPIERFGLEAAAFTRRLALDQEVRLERDLDCADRDAYGRLLRYVWLGDGRLLNAEILAQGYGFAFTRYPFARIDEFRALERKAREQSRGLWR